ncbi:MAG: hypothetical protein ACOX9R_15500 [Armatimonadota bacterium]
MRETVTAGDLTAVIGDNGGHEGQRAGYNGVQSLVSAHCPAPDGNLFVPGIAGINLEHLLEGRDMPDRDDYFEPRRTPMEVEKLDSQSVILHQSATPTLGVQSMATFSLRIPHYLDLDLRIVLRRDTLRHDYLLAFWASYINAPEDPAMRLLGRTRDEPVGEAWMELNSPAHCERSTVCHVDIEPELPHEISFDTLAYSYSELAFTRPFFYGRRRNMVFALMFEDGHDVRLTHSPTGGGKGNPAWDFQWVMHEPRVDEEHHLRARAVYKPWQGERDIWREYEQWDPLLS